MLYSNMYHGMCVVMVMVMVECCSGHVLSYRLSLCVRFFAVAETDCWSYS